MKTILLAVDGSPRDVTTLRAVLRDRHDIARIDLVHVQPLLPRAIAQRVPYAARALRSDEIVMGTSRRGGLGLLALLVWAAE